MTVLTRKRLLRTSKHNCRHKHMRAVLSSLGTVRPFQLPEERSTGTNITFRSMDSEIASNQLKYRPALCNHSGIYAV